jgi:hypothetical protein
MTSVPGVLGLELLGVPVRLACDDADLVSQLALCYARVRRQDVPAARALRASVERAGLQWRIRVDRRDERWEVDAIAAVRALNHELLHGVMRRAPELYYVHAAVVLWRGHGVVLPGRSRAGKSTLALALLLEGARFLSDELLAFDPACARALSFARAIKIRDECDGYFPDLAPAFAGSGEGRYLRFEALPRDVVAAEAPIDAVVVPTWAREGGTRLARITPGEALLALAQSSLNFGTHRQASLDCLAALVRKAETFSLRWSEPREAARALLGELAA